VAVVVGMIEEVKLPAGSRVRPVSVTIGRVQLERIEYLRKQFKVGRSELVRLAIQEFLDRRDPVT